MERVMRRWLLFILTACAPTLFAETRKPNVLFAFADDWGRHAGAYARLEGGMNDVIRTPNFDRLAAEGVLFRRAFVSSPSCTPCRSALLSGQHFWRSGRGAILQGAVWDSSNLAFPLMLQEAGYHIGKMYKVWSPGTPADAPIGGQKFAFEKAGRRFNDFSENVTQIVASGKSVDAAKAELLGEVGANFDTFLAARPTNAPFFFWFGPTNTHRKWERGSGKKLWGINPDDFKGKLPPFLPDVPEVREDVADYFGEAMAFDAALGLLLKKLEAAGELENTLVVVSGDHGAPGFPHGKCNLYDFGSGVSLAMRWGGAKGARVVDDLVSLTDLAPTFLALAGLDVPAKMTGRSLANILRSEKSGIIEPERDAVFIGRERHVENAREGWLPYPQRTIRTQDFSLIINFQPDRWPLGEPYRLDDATPPTDEQVREQTRVTLPDDDAGPTKAWLVSKRNDPQWKPVFENAYGKRPRIELFDLVKDPYQMRNVANDPAYAATCAALEKRLLDELRRTGDPRMEGDGKFFETPPMAGPLPGKGRENLSPAELRKGTAP